VLASSNFAMCPRVRVSDGEALRQLALGSNGLARLAVYTVRDDIAAGRLIPVLEDFNPGDHEDFLAERGRVE
jgi:DNA-binding transcriptional LysR family regulator